MLDLLRCVVLFFVRSLQCSTCRHCSRCTRARAHGNNPQTRARTHTWRCIITSLMASSPPRSASLHLSQADPEQGAAVSSAAVAASAQLDLDPPLSVPVLRKLVGGSDSNEDAPEAIAANCAPDALTTTLRTASAMLEAKADILQLVIHNVRLSVPSTTVSSSGKWRRRKRDKEEKKRGRIAPSLYSRRKKKSTNSSFLPPCLLASAMRVYLCR